MSESTPLVDRCHLELVDGLSDDLVLKLPEAVEFVNSGLQGHTEAAILIHSFDLTRMCIAACAYCKPVFGTTHMSSHCLLNIQG
jgi:hypothetical protein